MLGWDPFSESILFQCDRCRRVGELFTEVVEVEEEGSFYCWNCMAEIQKLDRKAGWEKKEPEYATR